VKFRVTYWPGTAAMKSCCVAQMGKDGELDRIAKSFTIEAHTFAEARPKTFHLINTSDGCLIEPLDSNGEVLKHWHDTPAQLV
jgi:hypothetical protein